MDCIKEHSTSFADQDSFLPLKMLHSSVACLGSLAYQQFEHAVSITLVCAFAFYVVQVNYIVLASSFLASLCNVLIIYAAWRIVLRNGVFTHVFIIWMSLGDLLLSGRLFLCRDSFLSAVRSSIAPKRNGEK